MRPSTDLRAPQSGSSPRLRGTCAYVAGSPPPLVRFIPAPAGNMRLWPCQAMLAPVHPRACGEHRTNLSANSVWLLAVHPRACGEHNAAAFSSSSRLAVHPRACGEHRSSRRTPNVNVIRFIPAPAGNIHGSSAREHSPSSNRFIPAPAGNMRIGLSRVGVGVSRFIPAPAGNISRCWFIPAPAYWQPPVHPRACGEHLRRLARCRLRPTRFIPAPAGNIIAAVKPVRLPAGSSPRLRGT